MTKPQLAAGQLPLNLKDPRWRPCADIEGVKWALDIDWEDVDQLIDLGELIAFNIAIDPAGRREIRVLTRSIEFYRGSLGSRRLQLSDADILRLMIPHTKPVILGTEIDSALNCDIDTRQRLVHAREFEIISRPNSPDWRPGPGGSPIVTRASFEQFLKRRRL